MERRSLLVGACCSFFAGIGVTAVAAWVQLQRENRLEDRGIRTLEVALAAEKAMRERLESDVTAARNEARCGVNHVRSLLREPRVSKSDHATDRAAAQEWLRKMIEVD